MFRRKKSEIRFGRKLLEQDSATSVEKPSLKAPFVVAEPVVIPNVLPTPSSTLNNEEISKAKESQLSKSEAISTVTAFQEKSESGYSTHYGFQPDTHPDLVCECCRKSDHMSKNCVKMQHNQPLEQNFLSSYLETRQESNDWQHPSGLLEMGLDFSEPSNTKPQIQNFGRTVRPPLLRYRDTQNSFGNSFQKGSLNEHNVHNPRKQPEEGKYYRQFVSNQLYNVNSNITRQSRDLKYYDPANHSADIPPSNCLTYPHKTLQSSPNRRDHYKNSSNNKRSTDPTKFFINALKNVEITPLKERRSKQLGGRRSPRLTSEITNEDIALYYQSQVGNVSSRQACGTRTDNNFNDVFVGRHFQGDAHLDNLEVTRRPDDLDF